MKTECANKAVQYLQFIESNSNVLKELYKRANMKGYKKDKKEQPKSKTPQGQEILTPTKRQNIRNPLRIADRVFAEDDKDSIVDGMRRKFYNKPVIGYKEFIKNKSVTNNIMKINIKTEVYLTSLFLIAPILTPTRLDRVFCEKEKMKRLMARKRN